MKRLLFLIIITLYCSGLIYGQAETHVFTQANALPEIALVEKHEFSVGEQKFVVDTQGKGIKTGKSTSRFTLTTEGGEIQRIYFAEFQNDLILQYELTYGGEGNAAIVRLDGKTLRPKWRTTIPAFNAGQGLIENSFAYLTAIGFVAKLNLSSGKFVWKHDNLYGKGGATGSYNKFALPKIEGTRVLFQEEIAERTPKIIKVSNDTGKLIEF